MSSSMRNAIQRRNHKERSQPAARQKWGLLEKRKDYLARAHNYKAKQKTLKSLTSLAAARNPDEYYFAMNSTTQKTRANKARKAGDNIVAKELDNDEALLLKGQDVGYVRTLREMEKKRIGRLEQTLQFGGEGGHTVFVDDAETAKNFKPEEYFDTPEELLERRENRVRKVQIENGELDGVLVKEDVEDEVERRRLENMRRKKEKRRELAYRELMARMEREKDFAKMEREMEEQTARMKKGAAKNGKANRWNQERKR